MLKYEQLKNIALSNFNTNLFELAKKNGIDIQNQDQCKKDWKGKETPLTNNKAILAKKSGEHIIYYDDTCVEYKFYIAHEVSHYILKHCKDSFLEESEANILACMIIAPIEKLIEKNITSHIELSKIFQIPILQAEEYYNLLLDNEYTYAENIRQEEEILKKRLLKQYEKTINKIEKDEFKKLISKNSFIKSAFLGLITLSIISIFSAMYLINKDTKTENSTETQSNNTPSIEEFTQENTKDLKDITVYVTSAGKKYHLSDCRYIKNKTNIHEFSLDDAKKTGYQPCSICVK